MNGPLTDWPTAAAEALCLLAEAQDDAARALAGEARAWREGAGLEPSRADKARLGRWIRLAARAGVVFAPWGLEVG